MSDHCTATFTPPSLYSVDPLPCVLAEHPSTPFHESAPVGHPERPWAWRDGAPGSTLPAIRETEARALEEGDTIEYRGVRLVVGEVLPAGCGTEIRTVDGPRIVVDGFRKFLAQRE
ncbi:hypothetical protein [Kitasatospora fiedleri]|uniref:hypothetical protein n=1 Tax=Kitasatospora fiedleri TaxID=2991545 RepID=UPI00249A7F29|nr:hypothetical protein [Kitasatospora fiedleri]